jgi:hypothetical protein
MSLQGDDAEDDHSSYYSDGGACPKLQRVFSQALRNWIELSLADAFGDALLHSRGRLERTKCLQGIEI